MTTGLLLVIGISLLYAAYVTGIKHGILYTDDVWRSWLKVQSTPQRTSVEDLYPEKKND